MKKKNVRPDDYYNDGTFEIARYGRTVAITNQMTSEQHEFVMNKLADQYEVIVKEIDEYIRNIRQLVVKCDPLKLLKYAYGQFFMSLLGITSEVQLKEKDIIRGREIEYIQCILASTKMEYFESDVDQSTLFFQISEEINKLYEKINRDFFLSYTAKERRGNPEISSDAEIFIIESILATLYRGDRYPIFEIEHLQELLLPQNDIFLKLFRIEAADFIKGLLNIQNALSKGMHTAFMDLDNLILEFDSLNLGEDYLREEIPEIFREMIKSNEKLYKQHDSFVSKFVGYGLHDLSILTNWPDDLLQKLSWAIGEELEFFKTDKYAGWPIIEMPIFKRPFIKIDSKYYCFDYYNLFDNIYRVIQKLICTEDPGYKEMWNIVQMAASEKIVSELFQKLLPGCIVLESNYYPLGNSLKNCAENDLIIIYDDHIFIVEVKAGSYTYTSPIYDIDSHITSLKTLIGKADSQAVRTLKYLQSQETAKIYDRELNEKCTIKLGDFNEVATMCVTLDNFNEFAAKAEKISFLTLNDTTIAISIDDLRVYDEYFDSPGIFLHYIKQRKRAAKNDRLALNDELDHLGMYIGHNIYSITADNMAEGRLSWIGYREEIDKYFSSILVDSGAIQKPVQPIPIRLKEIIEFLDKSALKNRSSLVIFLLDLASDARDALSSQIDNMLERQPKLGHMVISNTFGEVRYCLVCYQDNVGKLTDQYIKDYCLSTMVVNEEESRLELRLHYSDEHKLKDLEFHTWNQKDIPLERMQELRILGEKYAESRIISFKRQTGVNKIGRNEKCPCGSGLKYKKCHGR